MVTDSKTGTSEKTKETFMKVLDVNLVGPFLLSKK